MSEDIFNTQEQPIQTTSDNDSGFGDTLLEIVSYLIVLPLYLLAIQIVPDLDWFWNIDRILLFVICIFIVRFLLDMFRTIAILATLGGLGFLCYNSFINDNPYAYGWSNAFNDYKELIYLTLDKTIEPTNIVADVIWSDYAQKVQKATIDKNSIVKNFAQECIENQDYAFQNSEKIHPQYATLIKSFAIFKVINNNWIYQAESDGEDIPIEAYRTAETFTGDCEDHAILMTASIKSIGGKVRIVLSNGHAYPEIYIGNRKDFNKVKEIIKKELFSNIEEEYLYYHTENGNEVWLNLDYTEHYPGGHFLNNNDKKLSVIKI